MVSGEVLAEIKKDKIAIEILSFVKSKGASGAHLNELARELKVGSRVTILDRLTKLEDAGVLVSNMELSRYGEEKVQKWMRKYRLSKSYEGAI